jgi:hypothetical protein
MLLICVQALAFFCTVERLFGYFLCSVHRWNAVKEFVAIIVQRHSDIRRSSKAAAVPFRVNLKVIAAFEQLRHAPTATLDTLQDAARNVSGTEKFEFEASLCFPSEVASFTDRIQKCLQAEGTTFHQSLNQLGTLIDLTHNGKNELRSRAICDAEGLCDEWGVTESRRIKKISPLPGEDASDVGLNTP